MHFAIISGFCASLASLFGKLSGIPAVEDYLIIKVVFFGLMIACNACVWTFFVKALHSTDSTLSATVASTAANYIFSALFGFLVFNESMSLIWWAGLSFIFLGLILLCKDDEIKEKSK